MGPSMSLKIPTWLWIVLAVCGLLAALGIWLLAGKVWAMLFGSAFVVGEYELSTHLTHEAEAEKKVEQSDAKARKDIERVEQLDAQVRERIENAHREAQARIAKDTHTKSSEQLKQTLMGEIDAI